MPGSRSPSVSVCIPHYGKRPEVLRRAVHSAMAGLPHDASVVVVADGSAATRSAAAAELPAEVRVVSSDKPLGLVGNWNRCLEVADGRLVHLLHDDDAVTPAFYQAVLALEDQFPRAGLLVTGFSYFEHDGAVERGGAPIALPPAAAARLLSGDDASRFLLRQGRHVCGSVVLTRHAIEAAGPFDPSFPYCPDEEAYFRYAKHGGVAFDDRPLYLERIHPAQERFRTWQRDDFVRTYIAARVRGAERFGEAQAALARRVTGANVTRLAVRLAGEGYPAQGLRHLDELATILPEAQALRTFRLARWACTNKIGTLSARAAVAAGWVALRLRRGTRVGRPAGTRAGRTAR